MYIREKLIKLVNERKNMRDVVQVPRRESPEYDPLYTFYFSRLPVVVREYLQEQFDADERYALGRVGERRFEQKYGRLAALVAEVQ